MANQVFLIWGSTEDPAHPFTSDRGAIRGAFATRELAEETMDDFTHAAHCFKTLGIAESERLDTWFWIEEVELFE